MNKLIFASFAIFQALIGNAPEGQNDPLYGVETQKEKPPHATIKIGDIYIDKTEVSNIHWLEYLYYKGLELEDDALRKLLPDSNNNWFRIPSHRYEPITLITYQQAIDYCKWRSEVVSDRFGIEVTYRLPTIVEWELVATTVLDKKGPKIIKELDAFKKSLKEQGNPYFLVNRVLPLPENKVYDLFSNVSEMTFAEGVAKGSNNNNILTAGSLLKDVNYQRPHAYLGFRCVAEVKNDFFEQKMRQYINDKKVLLVLETLQTDAIPKEIGQLTNIVELEVVVSELGNDWTIQPPMSFYENRELEPPYRKIPESIGNLNQLKSLRLMNLDIHQLPNTITKLKNLEYLNLSFNKLNLSEHLSKFKKLKNLKELHVIGNHFDEKTMQRFITELPNLKLFYKPE